MSIGLTNANQMIGAPERLNFDRDINVLVQNFLAVARDRLATAQARAREIREEEWPAFRAKLQGWPADALQRDYREFEFRALQMEHVAALWKARIAVAEGSNMIPETNSGDYAFEFVDAISKARPAGRTKYIHEDMFFYADKKFLIPLPANL